MPIDPGLMRSRLVYQANERVDLGGGASRLDWTDRFTLWARVRPAKADESVQAGPQVQGRVEYEITCRYDPRIVATGRFKFEGTARVLDISAVIDWDLRGVELTVRAHEIQA